jgi:hypothetical protein
MDDEPRFTRVDLAIAVGLALLIAVWLVAYVVVAVRTLFA